MIKDIVRTVEIFTKTSDPPEMQERLMYRVVYRDGSKDEFTHQQWHEIVTRGTGALNQGSPTAA
jgi:hypothetical protein|tara:strand:- start:112 stop:303 length:192 start_codon:yes stop_codon:yes gene_type:complete